MSDLAARVLATIEAVERSLQERQAWGKPLEWSKDGDEWPAFALQCRCAADRRIVAEHHPVLRSVEWPHDQTGDSRGWVCPRCQNAENDNSTWRPPVGMAGEFPHEGFVTSYVLAPCVTLLALAEGYGIEVK